LDIATLESIVRSGLSDCDVSVSEQGGHYTVTAIGDCFEGLRPVKRQQLVYATLAELISSGAIHAVNIRAMTPSESAVSK
jgi:acid stress-induced BolA-like protein IbaG/YrbA